VGWAWGGRPTSHNRRKLGPEMEDIPIIVGRKGQKENFPKCINDWCWGKLEGDDKGLETGRMMGGEGARW